MQQITLNIKHADAHNYPFFAKKYLLTGKKSKLTSSNQSIIDCPMFANYFASGLQNYRFSYLPTLRTRPVRLVSAQKTLFTVALQAQNGDVFRQWLLGIVFCTALLHFTLANDIGFFQSSICITQVFNMFICQKRNFILR